MTNTPSQEGLILCSTVHYMIESNFIPRAALASAMASTEQEYAPMSQINAMLLRMTKLEHDISVLRATKSTEPAPPSPKRHEKFANVDATSFASPIPPPDHQQYEFDEPAKGPSDNDSIDDFIPYMTTVTVRVGTSTHYNCQVLECIKAGRLCLYSR